MIDLRYVAPFVAFYVPGAMLAFGAWLLGFSRQDARGLVAALGGVFGAGAFGVVAFLCAEGIIPPLRISIAARGGRDE